MKLPLDHRTERLRLRSLDRGAAPQVLRYYETNADFRAEWSPIPDPAFFTLARQRELLAAEAHATAADQQLRAWIFLREDPDTIIGFASLSNIVRGAFQSCHLGYEMHADHLNRGYITEALRALVFEIAFGPLRLHRVEANVMPRNARSRRVLEKLGFVEEGLARRYLRINGVWEDHVHFVALNDALE